MRRFLARYAILGAGGLLGGALAMIVVLHDVDLRFEAFAAAVLVPALQAALLAITFGSDSPPLRDTVRALAARRAALGALVVGIGVAFLTLGLRGAGGAPPRLELLAALEAFGAALLLAASLRTAARPGDRIAIGLLALVAAGLAVSVRLSWLPWLAAWVLPKRPLLLQWMAAYVPLGLVAILVALRAQRALARRDLLAARLLDGALFSLFLAGLVVVPSLFLRPYLVPPATWAVPFLLAAAGAFALACGASAATAPPAAP